jgi:hypothetical protein
MRTPRVLIKMICASSVVLTTAVAPSFAHHSQAMFDLTKTVTYVGTVTQVDWANPHVFIYIDAVKEGSSTSQVEHWSLEGQSPGFLINNDGWSPETVKVGDKITVVGNPRKDGQPTMLLLTVMLSNGKQYSSKPRGNT